MNEHPGIDDAEDRRRLEEAELIRDEEELALLYLGDKVSMSNRRRAALEGQQDEPPEDPA